MNFLAASEHAVRAGVHEICFHCGEPVPAGVHWRALIDGAERRMCCAGCKAVAETITGAGLSAFYDQRESLSQRAAASKQTEADDLTVFDAPAYQLGVVRNCAGGIAEVSLLIDGVTCAACIWLIEQRLRGLDGVLEAAVNFSTLRAVVRWDTTRVRLSTIIGAIRSVGYAAEPFDVQRSETHRRGEQRRSLWRLFVAAFGMMQIMMYAVPAYLAEDDLPVDIDTLMRWASLLLTLPVIGFSARPFFLAALRDVRARTVGMDVPVSIGIGVTFVASVYATWTAQGAVYFDSIAMFVFLLLAARYLETVLRMRAGEALDRIARLVPAFATRLSGSAPGAPTQRVAVAELRPGDCVVVGAGEAIPADGRLVCGESAVNESLLTGEARGVDKRAGDAVIGGSMNIASQFVMRVEQVGADTMVAGIGRLLERASAEKPRIAQLADRIAAPFTAAILIIAAGAALAWWFIDPAQAIVIAVTVLVITCPCALALATPAAVAAAAGSLARLGVLVTRARALETLARATHFVFDKTGTLTTGKLTLIGVIPLAAEDRACCLALAAALEANTRHPVGIALQQAAQRADAASLPVLCAVRDVAGEGVEATLAGRKVRIGRPAFVADLVKQPLPNELRFVADHVQVVVLGNECGWICLFTLGDTIRPTAKALIRDLRVGGHSVWLLSGDRKSVAAHVGRELGIENIRAQARPEEKLQFIRELQRQGAVVAMIGDGVNDAPVLAQAQVSVAMGEGADAAQASADIVLSQSGLNRLKDALAVARRSERIIKQNFAWAILYNAIAVPAAVLGWVSPLLASIGMAASSAIVIGNALRAAHPVLWQRMQRTRVDAGQSPEGHRYEMQAS
jgi:Cu2+-exporting ATPase